MMGIHKSMQTRLMVILGGGLGGLFVAAILAIAQLNKHLDEYANILLVDIAQERSISEINLSFKTQVQEWKNVLLRGHHPEQYEKYWSQFTGLQEDIQADGKALLTSLPEGRSADLVRDFLAAHAVAFVEYQRGAQAFRAANFDHTAGDNAVTGIDREPSRLLSEAAQEIAAQVQQHVAATSARSEQISFWSTLVVILVALLVMAIIWYTLRVSFLQPMNSIMAHLQYLAEGNFTRRLVLDREDELGRLGNNINHMQTAVVQIIAAVKTSAMQLGEASADINKTASEIARYSGETQESTDQVAAAVNEMSSTVQEVAGNASGAATAAQEADNNARNGLSIMTQTMDSMTQLSHEVDNVETAMTQLDAETKRVSNVLDVIKNVAEQTNLLALNAAIEAARAGEQGRGFAVVADEVRALAKRTQESTAEIQQIIQAVQNGAAQAMQAMKQSQEKTRTTTVFASRAGQSITDITAAVGRIHDMNTQIATAAEEQSYAAEEINKNVIRVVGLVQSTNKSAQHSTHIATNLDNAARQLSVQIANFQV
jgi:methyl-accepting chemotaxis protein